MLADAQSLPRMLKVQDVMDILNISRPHTYDLVNRPDFPALRFGKAIRIPRDQFLEWLNRYRAEQMAARRGGEAVAAE